jgi:membrane protease YdiL (CAAX protease family)
MADTVRRRLRAVGVAVLVAVLGFVLGFAALVVLGNLVFAAGVELSGPVQLVLSLVALQGVGFPLAAVAYLRYRGLGLSYVRASWPSARDLGIAVLGWVVILVLITVVGVVLASTGTEPAQNQAGQTAGENPAFIPYLIPLVFLLNAPGEELLFRGVIQTSLREEFGPVASIVLAASMFAPAHVIALLGSPRAVLVSVAILFVPALVFGAVYEYTENLVVPSLTHALNNSFLFLLLYLSATAGGEAVLAL